MRSSAAGVSGDTRRVTVLVNVECLSTTPLHPLPISLPGFFKLAGEGCLWSRSAATVFPPPNMTDEEFRETADSIVYYIKGICGGPDQAKLLRITGQVLGGAAVLGLGIGLFVALGQTLAIGFRPAYHKYGIWWFAAPLLGASVPITFFTVALIFFAGLQRASEYFSSLLSTKARALLKRIGNWSFPFFLIAMLAGTLAGVPIFFAYDYAKNANEILTSADSNDVAALSQAISNQHDTLSKASQTSRNLLSDLDRTAAEIHATRELLAKTIANLDSQSNAVSSANSEVQRLADRQEQIQLRVQELERLLDGKAPITRGDLERSGRTGLIIGAIFGFLGSLAATVIFERFMRARRSRKRNV